MFDVLKVGCCADAAMLPGAATGPDVVSGPAINSVARQAVTHQSQCIWTLDTLHLSLLCLSPGIGARRADGDADRRSLEYNRRKTNENG